MSEERYNIRDKKIFGRKELTNKRWIVYFVVILRNPLLLIVKLEIVTETILSLI